MYTFSVQLPLLGICRINLEKREVARFSYRQLGNYVVGEIKEEYESSENNRTNLLFESNSIVKEFSVYKSYNMGLDRGTCWNTNSISIGNYKYILDNNVLRILIYKPHGNIEILKYIYKRVRSNTEEKKYALLGGQFYHNILFPIFTVYAAVYGLFCVHGSLIHTKNNRNIILSGLDGVGKSSLADMICSEEGNELLADNIVLFDGKKALNLNLAMRLELTTVTKNKVIYSNKEIKEILPPVINFGFCNIDRIFNLLRDNNDQTVKFNHASTPHDWIMFMERAPEIGQANNILSYWLFVHSLIKRHERITVPIISVAIPNGKLVQGKEFIENELKILD